MATAMPVLPDVASTTVIPGLSSPRFSASSMIATCVEINQCVGCTRKFFTKSCLGRAARNRRHCHAIEQNRVDGVEADAAIQDERAVKP